MKRLKAILVLIAMSLTSFSAMASDTAVDGIYYDFDSENKTAIVTYRGYNSVSYSNEYTGDVVIPAKVTYEGVEYDVTAVGEWAFMGCSFLTSITIPEGVTAIGDYAFYDCSGLTSITIPESVTTIENYAFYDCEGLTSITIPEGVTAIGDYAFSGCDGLTSITIPESVTAIGDYAFSYCDGLTSIIVDENNTTYDSRNNCNAIIETASNTLIVGCKLTVIPEGVTAIGESAFEGCSSLTSITIPESVTAIGDDAFYDCDGLTSITIPEGVTAIGEWAFSYCSGLTSIIVDENNTTYNSRNNCNAIIETASNTLIVGCKLTVIPEGVTAIGESAFEGCSSLTSITIPESVTAIGDDAFYDCDGLTSITIPEGVTAIGESVFSDCDGLTSITIPEGVTAIGDNAFYLCSGLTSITIPESVTAIGWDAFDGCSGLTSIISLNTTPPSCDGSYVFYNVDKSIPFYVPKESVDSYKSAKCWSEFTNMIGTDFVRISINDAVNGMVTGVGVYPVNSPATVTATPNAGYAFVKWSDGNTDNPRKIVMTEDVTLEAIFEVDSSPISNVTAEEITVRVVNGTLVVTGASDYLVYDLAGKCMGKPERLERGIYIVVADGNSYKMIVK